MFSLREVIFLFTCAICLPLEAMADAPVTKASSVHARDDVVYYYRATDRSDGMDARLSLVRNTISVGGLAFQLKPCPPDGSLVCLKSDYFNLLVPRSQTGRWSDGQYDYFFVGKHVLAFVGSSEPVMIVSSTQGHSLFTFYVTEKGNLLGWTQVSRWKGIPASYLANPVPL